MIRRLKDKLKAESGVSLLYGLVFLLVAVMVSSVILQMAVTMVQRVHNDQVQEQNMLSVRSAGNVVARLLDETTFEVVRTMTDDDEPVIEVTGQGPLSDVLEPKMEEAVVAALDPEGSLSVSSGDDFSFPLEVSFNGQSGAGAALNEPIDEKFNVAVSLTNTTASDLSLDSEQGDIADVIALEAIVSLDGANQRLFVRSETPIDNPEVNGQKSTWKLSWTSSKLNAQ